MKELKALKVLKDKKSYLDSLKRNGLISDAGRDELKLIEEAIAELEALQAPKTCDGCRDQQQKYLNMCDSCIRYYQYKDHYDNSPRI